MQSFALRLDPVPVSCKRISATTPTANFQPKISAYAATAMKIVENLTRMNANFASVTPTATIGASALRIRPRQFGPVWIGSYCGGSLRMTVRAVPVYSA